MFSQTAEYALRAMVVLANQPGRPSTAQEISSQAKVPLDYLLKVLHTLGRAGLLNAQRGKHGGFTLARDPADITILDIINCVDPIRRIRSCPLQIESHGARLCPLHRKLDAAIQSIEESFSTTALSELVQGPAHRRPLCGGMIRVQTAHV